MLQIGTRGSKLATTQAGHVRDWIIAAGAPAELKIVKTEGDVNMAPVERIGVGVFTQKLREVLDAGGCDVAVHSFKDLPTAADDRFHLVIPKREDNREALIARDGLRLDELPEGARVGTSAPRRISQLLSLRPDLDIRPLRGNIETRMSKIDDGELDAVVLAYAGLIRNGYQDKATQVFAVDEVMPAPAQGALAVEVRVNDAAVVEVVGKLTSVVDRDCAFAERVVLNRLEAGCTAPVAAYSTFDEQTGMITAHGGVFALDGKKRLLATASGTDPIAVGEEVSQALLADGAAELLGDS
ncbi:hydroxymethylbilane synthase [Corynebacterium pseudodiphtheriticum]|uniref:hydroxymethylbilane synthase n=1 Tax=Corynebacterium pseudodiphtheriticum TaxID=37637 RepID=UPI00201BC1CC|nr:hydroxymethylbilane synthase [Corynebacterium pseudodiphtheriticum]UQV53886.1 hydroxymethylbilane synthase [Corynebacterium pseudodiphtheriticum]